MVMMNDKFDTVLRVAQKARERIMWPSLPASKAQTAWAILYQMEQTKWRKPEVIHHQFTQLKSLLAQVFETTPFHRNRLDASGLAPHFDYLKRRLGEPSAAEALQSPRSVVCHPFGFCT